MFASVRKLFKWGATRNADNKKKEHSSHIFVIMRGVLEDILFWKRMWLSLSFVLFINLIFFVSINKEIDLLQLLLYIYIFKLSIDGFESWLKYKHRTTCLKNLADHDGSRLTLVMIQIKTILRKKWMEFMYLRETNHTKAFLLMNIIFGVIFLAGKYASGYLLLYLLCMFICFFNKLAPTVQILIKKIQQNAESDVEFDGLIPEVSDIDLNLLSIEPEPNQVFDERQSLDYWKPDDVPMEEASDTSSENSTSLVRNLSMEKMRSLDKDVETSDSSEDEYIPLEQKEQLQSTLEVIQPSATWSSSAYNALWNLTGAVANMMYTKTDVTKRKRVSSVDSSDGFEIVEKQDFL